MQKPPLWDKQKEAISWIKARLANGRGACLFAEMGTGKSRCIVHVLEHLFNNGEARLVYIIGPLSALNVWIENWHDFADYPVAFIDLHDTGSEGIRMAAKLAEGGAPVICLCNYESAWMIGHKNIPRKRRGVEVSIFEKVDTTLADVSWDVGICDESDRLKTAGSKVSKFFRGKLAEKTKHKIVMTGTAYTKRPLDAWAQVNFACGSEVFPPNFASFKARYSIPHPQIRGAILGYKDLKDFTWRLTHCAMLIKKSEMFDLPDATHETITVDLSLKSRTMYDKLKTEKVLEIEELEDQWRAYRRAMKGEGGELPEKPIVATGMHIFSCMQHLMQITSGFLYPDAVPDPENEGKLTRLEAARIGREKLDELLAILDGRDDPTVIVTQRDEEERMIAEAIEKKFGYKPKILNGSVKGATNRHEMIAEAAKDRSFIVKESVGARGVDMRWADMIIFYSHSYDTSAYAQMLARNHRGGQTKNVTYIHLLCSGTIDIQVMAALRRDMNLAASIEKDWRKILA